MKVRALKWKREKLGYKAIGYNLSFEVVWMRDKNDSWLYIKDLNGLKIRVYNNCPLKFLIKKANNYYKNYCLKIVNKIMEN